MVIIHSFIQGLFSGSLKRFLIENCGITKPVRVIFYLINLNDDLNSSFLFIPESHRFCNRVQDAYTLRCCPQVHGIVHDTIDFVQGVITVEMNSGTDNPVSFKYKCVTKFTTLLNSWLMTNTCKITQHTETNLKVHQHMIQVLFVVNIPFLRHDRPVFNMNGNIIWLKY
jgi:Histidine ammonia-lyase